jgi:hypothetical protein
MLFDFILIAIAALPFVVVSISRARNPHGQVLVPVVKFNPGKPRRDR